MRQKRPCSQHLYNVHGIEQTGPVHHSGATMLTMHRFVVAESCCPQPVPGMYGVGSFFTSRCLCPANSAVSMSSVNNKTRSGKADNQQENPGYQPTPVMKKKYPGDFLLHHSYSRDRFNCYRCVEVYSRSFFIGANGKSTSILNKGAVSIQR